MEPTFIAQALMMIAIFEVRQGLCRRTVVRFISFVIGAGLSRDCTASLMLYGKLLTRLCSAAYLPDIVVYDVVEKL
jgi:hypothetical protein